MKTNHLSRIIRRAALLGASFGLCLPAIAYAGDKGNKMDETPPVSASAVKQEAAELVETISSYAEDQRDALNERADAYAERVRNEIKDARKSLDEVSDESREQLQAAIDRVERAEEKAEGELAKLRDSTGDAWKDAKSRFAAALEELGEARQEVADALTDA